ncbi:AraC family transcriptional regulator [Buchananella felis]|uniref:helix-turn-helix domain-containing protein n=1 Tax=Buchananella felis TaxID=3231492 RepID=UPI003528DD75
MCTDIARRWSLGELASKANLSSSRLNSLFKEELGITPLGMLTRLRVQEMTRMLRETGLTVQVIAQDVGWRDQAHAAQQFRKLTGLSPTEYRTETRSRAVMECFWCGQRLPASERDGDPRTFNGDQSIDA